jgi:hypothetical protein
MERDDLPSTDLPSDPWRQVLDAILFGFAHSLSNRGTAISGVAIELEHLGHTELARSVAAEARRLDELIRVMRLLPSRHRPPDAAQVELLAREAVALARSDVEIREVPFDLVTAAALPAVLAPVGETRKALTLLLAAAARDARQLTDARVIVRCDAEPRAVSVSIVLEGTAPGAQPRRQASTLAPADVLRAARALVAGHEVDVEAPDAPESPGAVIPRYILRLPTLVEARSRGPR